MPKQLLCHSSIEYFSHKTAGCKVLVRKIYRCALE